MRLSPNKKSLQPCSNQHASNEQKGNQNSLSDNYLFELKEWVRHMISEAEEKGDICKRNQFLALRAELT
jgi:hypothetical protein